MSDYVLLFREHVKTKLDKRGWDQNKLAEAIGCTASNVSHILSGTRQEFQQVLNICDVLNIHHGWGYLRCGRPVPDFFDFRRYLDGIAQPDGSEPKNALRPVESGPDQTPARKTGKSTTPKTGG